MIAEIAPGSPPGRRSAGATSTARGLFIVPGFIDVHVHGVEGIDTLDGATRSRRSRRGCRGTASPRSVRRRSPARPTALATMLAAVRAARRSAAGGARVLPAHLESNFINPEYRGAQPLECLRLPRERRATDGDFIGRGDPRAKSHAASADVGIVTIAPELDGAIDLIRELAAHGHRVSLGHSGATYEQALAGHRRRRAAGDASLQPHAAARPSRARPGRRGARERRGDRGDHLRRRPRPSRRWCAWRWPPSGPSGSWRSPTAPPAPACPGRQDVHRRPADHRRRRRLPRRRDAGRQRVDDGPGVCEADDGDEAEPRGRRDICSTTPARALGLQGIGVIVAGCGGGSRACSTGIFSVDEPPILRDELGMAGRK